MSRHHPSPMSNPTPASTPVSELNRRELLQLFGAAMTAAAVHSLHADAIAAEPHIAGDATRVAVVQLTVNGRDHRVDIDPRMSLLDLLRERLELTGTKKGCNQGACGACTVLVNGRRINSCLTLAVMLEGAVVTTVEGLAHGDQLHPMQAAFIAHDAFQCGYCTPGQIVSGVACVAEGHTGSPDEIRSWMSGNICRCGAYVGIVAAVSQVAKESKA